MSRSRNGALLGGRQPGFTLTELVIIIVLIGILAAVMGPRLADRRAFDTRGFHDELFSVLRFAQKLAIATQCEVGVDINSGVANGYALYFPDDADGNPATCDGAAAGFNGASPVPVQSPDLSGPFGAVAPTGVTITGALVFSYDALGRPSAGGAVAIVGTDTRTITVEPETGFVH